MRWPTKEEACPKANILHTTNARVTETRFMGSKIKECSLPHIAGFVKITTGREENCGIADGRLQIELKLDIS
jgi:hypothetical protein